MAKEANFFVVCLSVTFCALDCSCAVFPSTKGMKVAWPAWLDINYAIAFGKEYWPCARAGSDLVSALLPPRSATSQFVAVLPPALLCGWWGNSCSIPGVRDMVGPRGHSWRRWLSVTQTWPTHVGSLGTSSLWVDKGDNLPAVLLKYLIFVLNLIWAIPSTPASCSLPLFPGFQAGAYKEVEISASCFCILGKAERGHSQLEK